MYLEIIYCKEIPLPVLRLFLQIFIEPMAQIQYLSDLVGRVSSADAMEFALDADHHRILLQHL